MRVLLISCEPQLARVKRNSVGSLKVAGAKYRIGRSGERTIELVQNIVYSREHYLTRLIAHREHLTEIIQLGRTGVLTYLTTQVTQPENLALIIWLRGRCGGNVGTNVIAAYRAKSFPNNVRRQVAKAMKRMHGWSTLYEMAKCDDDARVRALARTKVPASYGERMTSFMGHVAPIKSTSEPQPLYVSPAVELSKAWRLKSSEFIRMILERIRRLVRSGA